jgi:hypothetical protein
MLWPPGWTPGVRGALKRFWRASTASTVSLGKKICSIPFHLYLICVDLTGSHKTIYFLRSLRGNVSEFDKIQTVSAIFRMHSWKIYYKIPQFKNNFVMCETLSKVLNCIKYFG